MGWWRTRHDCCVTLSTSILPSAVRLTERPSRIPRRLRDRQGGYDRLVERAVHDRGGWPTGGTIERTETERAYAELRMDAIVAALGSRGVVNTDELRRGIESMPPDEYERASYYERWLYSVETVLKEKGVLD